LLIEKGQTILWPKEKKDECTNNDRKIIKIEQHASHLKPRVKSGAPEGYLIPESSARTFPLPFYVVVIFAFNSTLQQPFTQILYIFP
jgi:hypothetical protein